MINKYSVLLLPLFVISCVRSQDCLLPTEYTNVQWYETLTQYWTFTYTTAASPQTLITYYSGSGSVPSTCKGSNVTSDVVYFFYNLFYSQGTPTCNRVVITSNAGAILLTRVTPPGATGISSCLSAYTEDCYKTGQCSAKWHVKGSGSPVNLNAAVTTCPFAAGTYSVTLNSGVLVKQCSSLATVTSTQIIIGSCLPALDGSTTAKSAVIYNGTTLTCMGNLSASAIYPTADVTSPSLLLLTASKADGQNVAMYCARYMPLSNGVSLTLDVSNQQATDTRNQIAQCGTFSTTNVTNQFLSLTLGPVWTTTSNPPTTAPATTAAITTAVAMTTASTLSPVSSVSSSSVSTQSSTSTTTMSSTPSSSPSSTSWWSSSQLSTTSFGASTPPGSTVPALCVEVRCPDGQQCGITGQCLCSSGSAPVNGTCPRGAANEVVVRGILIGLLLGSAVGVVLAGLALCLCGRGKAAAAEPSKSSLTDGEGLTVFASHKGGVNVNDVELMENTSSLYPTVNKMTLRSSPSYSAMANDTYVMINSTIPSN